MYDSLRKYEVHEIRYRTDYSIVHYLHKTLSTGGDNVLLLSKYYWLNETIIDIYFSVRIFPKHLVEIQHRSANNLFRGKVVFVYINKFQITAVTVNSHCTYGIFLLANRIPPRMLSNIIIEKRNTKVMDIIRNKLKITVCIESE